MWRTLLENTLGILGGELRAEWLDRRENPADWAAELRRRQVHFQKRALKHDEAADRATTKRERKRARRRERNAMNLAEYNARRAERWARRAAKR